MVTEACMPEEPVYIYLDRPFVFAIVDTDSGLPVFCGVVSALR
jgi:serpin B